MYHVSRSSKKGVEMRNYEKSLAMLRDAVSGYSLQQQIYALRDGAFLAQVFDGREDEESSVLAVEDLYDSLSDEFLLRRYEDLKKKKEEVNE